MTTFFSTNRLSKKFAVMLSSRLVLIFMSMTCTLPAGSVESEGNVVLIAASGSNIDAMSHRDIRRLYLGFKSTENKSVNDPVLNIHSEEVYDAFLKNIMRMTAGSYKRKLVKAIFRQGREEIVEMKSLEEINEHLLENKGDISFVELTSMQNMENIEVVQVLW